MARDYRRTRDEGRRAARIVAKSTRAREDEREARQAIRDARSVPAGSRS